MIKTPGHDRPDVLRIQTTDSPEDAYRTIGRLFTAEGYGLTNSDSELLTLTTEPRSLTATQGIARGEFVDARYTVSVVPSTGGSVVVLRGTYDESVFKTENNTTRQFGAETSVARAAWNEMERIPNLYPGGTVVVADPN